VIKLLDRLDNLRDFDPERDPKFGRLYCQESSDLVAAIGNASPFLEALVRAEIAKLSQAIEHATECD
jgi:hypothetical protein